MAETLTTLLSDRAQQWPNDLPFTVLDADGGESRFTYAALEGQARAIASGLAATLPRGSRVLVAGPTNVGFVAGFFGCMYAGMLPVPVPPPLPGPMARRFAEIMADCDPSLVLTSTEWLPLFQHLPIRVAPIEECDGSDDFAPVPTSPDDLAYVQYTSGTTGPPRGAVFTHRQACAGLRLTCASMPAAAGQRTVGWLPLFHDLGLLTLMLLPLYVGQELFAMQPLDFVRRPHQWLHEMSVRQAACAAMPGFAFDLMVRKTRPEQRAKLDLKKCIALVCGADVLEPSHLKAFADAFGSTGVDATALCPSYGMAEAVGMVTASHPDATPSIVTFDRQSLERGWLVPSSRGVPVVGAGRPGAAAAVRIIDRHSHKVLETGAIGEIAVSGPHITTRYWNHPDSAVKVGGTQFLRSGDVGGVLNGELYILGRTTDQIVLPGRTLFPFDLERTVAAASPAVRPRACMAFTGYHGVVVAVELRPDSEPPATTVKAIRAAVSHTHRVDLEDVVVGQAGTLTFTTSGKPCRWISRERYRAGELTRN